MMMYTFRKLHKNMLKPKYTSYRFMFKLHFYHQFYQFYLCFGGKEEKKNAEENNENFSKIYIRSDLIANQI